MTHHTFTRPHFSFVCALALLTGSAAQAHIVLPAGGATLGWLLLMTLWLPLLNYARSYAPQVRAVQAALGPAPGCVQTVGLSRAQVAALQYHGGLSLQRAGLQDECEWLVADIASWPPSERISPRSWTILSLRPRDAASSRRRTVSTGQRPAWPAVAA